MKFRLKLGPFELSIDTPEPVQVSPTDLVTALWSAQTQMMGDIVLVREDEAED
ncbi:hypothetical protein IU443_29710 [Nocardia farcinica]|uniref:Uncharacterized protein n=1 Tax=Nocardia farcinica TaxID=37329 RepID=A0A0H5P905_NOCFR|nr:hypothetical protein [Nocardia farcinica]MBF6394108.1 hypothetical protein [Nocardia farcinica]MBF6538157.1 hypothetical protein [Nocardia farcinica]PFW98697.1 hypothetical protein CJ469_05950 [Nocardia farcinica]PFX04351.1 hypothetical protein CJ468_05597 [Nocardia farcinica]CRY84345.1 Uncharacterised protein [Nocardia farcinica]